MNLLSDAVNMNNVINEKLLQVACQRQITNCSFDPQNVFIAEIWRCIQHIHKTHAVAKLYIILPSSQFHLSDVYGSSFMTFNWGTQPGS